MMTKVLMNPQSFGCFEKVLSIVSMLSVESIFYFPQEKKNEVRVARNRFAAPEGDHLTVLAVYEAFMEAKDQKVFCWENFINMRAMKKVLDVRQQLVEYTSKSLSHMDLDDSPYDQNEQILRCFASAFFTQVAILQDNGRYHTLKDGKESFIHPSSALFHRKNKPKCVVYNELVRILVLTEEGTHVAQVLTSKQFMRDVSEVQPSWLAELAPLQYGK